MFPTAKIHLGDGRTLLIHSSREAAASPETATHSIFVQRATLNGKEQNSSWLPLSRIGGNSTLDLTLGPKPSPIWGKTMADRPPSLTKKAFQSR
jgi:putative alpha-1,2-mannosidase